MDNKTGATRHHLSKTPTQYRGHGYKQERLGQHYQQRNKSPNRPQMQYHPKGEYYQDFQHQSGKRASFHSKRVHEESDSDFAEADDLTQPSRRTTAGHVDLNRSEIMNSSYMEEMEEENDHHRTASLRTTVVKEDRSPMKKTPSKAQAMLFHKTSQRFQSYFAEEENQLMELTREPMDKFRECMGLYSGALKSSEEVIYKYKSHDSKEFDQIAHQTKQLSMRAKKVQKIK